jgi:hypothetical protein
LRRLPFRPGWSQTPAIDRRADHRFGRTDLQVLPELIHKVLRARAHRGLTRRVQLHPAEHAARGHGREQALDALAAAQVVQRVAEVALVVDQRHGRLRCQCTHARSHRAAHRARDRHAGAGGDERPRTPGQRHALAGTHRRRFARGRSPARRRPGREVRHHQRDDGRSPGGHPLLLVVPATVRIVDLLPVDLARERGVVAQLVDPAHARLPGQRVDAVLRTGLDPCAVELLDDPAGVDLRVVRRRLAAALALRALPHQVPALARVTGVHLRELHRREQPARLQRQGAGRAHGGARERQLAAFAVLVHGPDVDVGAMDRAALQARLAARVGVRQVHVHALGRAREHAAVVRVLLLVRVASNSSVFWKLDFYGLVLRIIQKLEIGLKRQLELRQADLTTFALVVKTLEPDFVARDVYDPGVAIHIGQIKLSRFDFLDPVHDARDACSTLNVSYDCMAHHLK